MYEDVNRMAWRVAEASGLRMVDRMAIGHGHRALFLGGTSRYSPLGHRVMGEALAEQLFASGLV